MEKLLIPGAIVATIAIIAIIGWVKALAKGRGGTTQ